jgi:hypothetical protein
MFDRHRVGSWEHRGAGRRCLSVGEMLRKGYSQNESGFWIREERLRLTRGSDFQFRPLPRRRVVEDDCLAMSV